MGHVIGAALCADGVFRDWAVRSNIPSVASVEELSSFLKEAPVDLIFSVANPFILPADVLGRVRRGAFNYHDGPLPRYAGTRATSWALLAQETDYAITWHRIDDGVDTGDIVVQRQVLIAPIDTTLTLNLKCYEVAIEGFRELLTGLAKGGLTTYSQALMSRSCFPRRRRPDAAGCLRWDRPAQDLSAMTRALNFGPYHPNSLGLSKPRGKIDHARLGPRFEWGGHSCSFNSRQSRNDDEQPRKPRCSGTHVIKSLEWFANKHAELHPVFTGHPR
ncbi:formyltransferase family protein [Bradyrhizobium sp. CCBAU 11357]|uniref:formyltransferase family protein n=1 Tax=Bradyrhizobium sp. CCBAU 11357 TaxID=1630808 RepID=UPI002303E310|nr:formyltransferase family protein [Bradyrhizobium sp. CCBAU 11357]